MERDGDEPATRVSNGEGDAVRVGGRADLR
jgi:hypothetical protein